mgnify:FL=1
MKIGFECNQIILDTPRIIKAVVNPGYSINSKYFVNSDGSKIWSKIPKAEIFHLLTIQENGKTEYKVINPETLEYESQQELEDPVLTEAKKIKDTKERLKFLAFHKNQWCNFL